MVARGAHARAVRRVPVMALMAAVAGPRGMVLVVMVVVSLTSGNDLGVVVVGLCWFLAETHVVGGDDVSSSCGSGGGRGHLYSGAQEVRDE